MSISESSGISQFYVDGKLVNKKGFIAKSDGENMEYFFDDNGKIIAGNINEKNKLNEEDLMKLLKISETNKSLFEALKKDYPLAKKTNTKKKKTKKKKTKKTKKK